MPGRIFQKSRPDYIRNRLAVKSPLVQINKDFDPFPLPSVQKYVLDAQKNNLNVTVLLST